MNEPTCRHVANSLLPWYLNGTLDEDEEAAVRLHVQGCAVCSAELDELAEVARSLSEQPGNDAELRPRPRAVQLPVYAAAALLLLAVLGLYWIYLGLPGLPSGRPAARDELVAGAFLDLGTGPTRDGSSLPILRLAPTIEAVTLSFVVPSGVGSSYTLELRDGEDRVLATPAAPPSRDAMGRVLLTAPASLFQSGECSLVVGDEDPATGGAVYRYPFRVVYRQSPAATKAPQ